MQCHLKVKVRGWGCPVTISSRSSEKFPKIWLQKVTFTVWQAPMGTTPSSGLKEKHLPNVVSGFENLKWASINPLFDICIWMKRQIHWFNTFFNKFFLSIRLSEIRSWGQQPRQGGYLLQLFWANTKAYQWDILAEASQRYQQAITGFSQWNAGTSKLPSGSGRLNKPCRTLSSTWLQLGFPHLGCLPLLLGITNTADTGAATAPV